MMMWMWIFAIVISLGGELNAEIEHQTAEGFNGGLRKAARRARRGDGRHNRVGALVLSAAVSPNQKEGRLLNDGTLRPKLASRP